uniref:Uncharacterized protein n=1 Tax=Aegilops tauschii subsp. strangulata TaxID=200361 RepID=A0A453P1M0_AEGTS
KLKARETEADALQTVQVFFRAFELLVADERLRIQIYYSREGRWGPSARRSPAASPGRSTTPTPWSSAAPSTGCATLQSGAAAAGEAPVWPGAVHRRRGRRHHGGHRD